MDPLSLTTSIAGIISLAEVVCKQGYKFWRECKDCPEELKKLVLEFNAFKGVLEGFGLMIEDAVDADLR
jgi:hypothetical protein